jgi:hypothetical protein
MKRKNVLALLFTMLLTATFTTACSNDEEGAQENANPTILSYKGNYLADVKGLTGTFHHDDVQSHNLWYIKTDNGDRYYVNYVTGEADKSSELKDLLHEDCKVQFDAKLYALNEIIVKEDTAFSKLAETVKLYILWAPDFTIQRITE